VDQSLAHIEVGNAQPIQPLDVIRIYGNPLRPARTKGFHQWPFETRSHQGFQAMLLVE
jgi:hypothetical protein